MIRTFITLVTIFILQTGFCQDAEDLHIDSLQHEVAVSNNDTMRLILLGQIAEKYSEINYDSSFYYAEKVIAITRNLRFNLDEAAALRIMIYAQINLGNFPRALQYLLPAIEMMSDPSTEKRLIPVGYPGIDEFMNRSMSAQSQRLTQLSRLYQNAGILYTNSNNFEKALHFYRISLPFAEESGQLNLVSITYNTLGRAYLSLKNLDSALYCLQKAYDAAVKSGYNRYVGSILLNTARVYMERKQMNTAAIFFRRAIEESRQHDYPRGVASGNLYLAEILQQTGQADSSLFYLRKALPIAHYIKAPNLLLRSYTALAKYYQSAGNNDSIVKYQSLIIKLDDSVFNAKQAQQFQNIDFDAVQRKQQVEAEKTAYKNKVTQYGLIAGLAVFLLVAFILYRNNRQKQKANKVLQATLMNLKTAQAQLIQSEKMASLGELTAGIAHEIQNPLNFVNNFSDVNKELIDEAGLEMNQGNVDKARSILNDIKENEEKILHHGKRADAIVKGMLQHSHTSMAQKEPTDVNALCEEYLRLVYHGLRAKEKSLQAGHPRLNVKFETKFDPSIGKIDVVPQEIGKVILNLLNNASYAVSAKVSDHAKTSSNELATTNGNYEPTVWLKTKKEGDKVLISVRDNGPGIAREILDKIFQPFFTTKPTGQGTGLGLSLAYDIVKAYGGKLKVETSEGGGSEFIIQLPTRSNIP
jgi:two-component system, NtrC family, sensor kinase